MNRADRGIVSATEFPRVLVAEDDPAIRRLLAATLRRRRLDVHVVNDGAEAQRELQNGHWAVVVLDLMMPNVNGWELIEWLSEHDEVRPASVVVMSAADREALLQLDPTVVNAIVFKPFDVAEVGAYVKSAAERGEADRRRGRVMRSV